MEPYVKQQTLFYRTFEVRRKQQEPDHVARNWGHRLACVLTPDGEERTCTAQYAHVYVPCGSGCLREVLRTRR